MSKDSGIELEHPHWTRFEKDWKDVEVWAREVTAGDNRVVVSFAMMLKELGCVVDTRMRMRM